MVKKNLDMKQTIGLLLAAACLAGGIMENNRARNAGAGNAGGLFRFTLRLDKEIPGGTKP